MAMYVMLTTLTDEGRKTIRENVSPFMTDIFPDQLTTDKIVEHHSNEDGIRIL